MQTIHSTFTVDYPRTLREWGRRLEVNLRQDVIMKDYPDLKDCADYEAFKRKWQYLFAYAGAGFAQGYITCHMLTFIRDVSPKTFTLFWLWLDRRLMWIHRPINQHFDAIERFISGFYKIPISLSMGNRRETQHHITSVGFHTIRSCIIITHKAPSWKSRLERRHGIYIVSFFKYFVKEENKVI